MKGLKIYLLLILITLAVNCTVNAQVQSNSRLAFEYFNDGEWSKAAPFFLEMYTQNQARVYLNYYIRCLSELGEFDQAEKELKKAQKQSKDVGIYVDLAYIYELQKDKKKADNYFEKPFREFPREINQIRSLGNLYISYRKFDHAYRVYEIGRSILSQPNEFRIEMANLYRIQRRHGEMLDEYLALLLNQPTYLNSIENYLMSSLSTDIDENLLEITKKKTLEYIQTFPGYTIFTELLIWVYIQENEFELAVDHAISLDIRNRNTGQQTLSLARKARIAGDYVSALRAYDYIASQSQEIETQNPLLRNPPQSPIQFAMLEGKQTKLEQLENDSNSDFSDFSALHKGYQEILKSLSNSGQKAYGFKDMAYIKMFYLNDYKTGLAEIDSALLYASGNPQISAACLIDKADFLLVSDDPWAATLLYARIVKENNESPIGSVAKLRKAKLAYYTGDFSWALSQLNVLKGSSSKLIANDAFELAGLIKNNQSEDDSLAYGLNALARAQHLLFQKKTDSCLIILDSLVNMHNDNPAVDDALFIKAEIMLKRGETEEAKQLFTEITKNYYQENWGHKALYRIAVILFEQGTLEESEELFTELITNFPNSFYNLDARDYIRKIKQLNLTSEESL